MPPSEPGSSRPISSGWSISASSPPRRPDRFSPGDVRRVLMAKSLEDAGIPLEGVAAAIQRGALSLDFLDAAAYERFAALAGETFRQVSDRTGIPLELLTVDPRGDRHGAAVARRPAPRGRDGDRAVHRAPARRGVPAGGHRAPAPRPGRQHPPDRRAGGGLVELRGDRAGHRPRARARRRSGTPSSPIGSPRSSEQAVLAMYHAQQARAWTANIIDGVRDADGAGGDPQPPRAAPGDLLPRHHRLHAADPGARRRRGRRPRRDASRGWCSAAPCSTAASPSSGWATA